MLERPLSHYWTSPLKTHIRDKWVCGMDTSKYIVDPQFIMLRYIAECGLSVSNGQVHTLKIWMVASDQALDPMQAVFACPLSPLYSHSVTRRMERHWGSHHWNASLRAADSLLMMIVTL